MKACILILLSIIYGIEVRKIARIDRAFVCKCASDCVIQNAECTLTHRTRESTLVNAKFTFVRNIEKITMGIGIERCRNSESLDTCENFGSLKIPNACDYLKERNSLVGNMVYSVHPPYKCPFKKGNYVAINGTLDANVFSLFPTDGWYWKFSSDYYNHSDSKFLWSFCFHAGVFELH